jgi:regulator of protease activity HflC (stomatin/prohibitin superfamily)
LADIKRYFFIRQLRCDASSHVQRFRKGRRMQSGRGLAFWFFPDGASISEIPMDDRELPFIFTTRSSDFQEITVQGTILWRVDDPEKLGDRLDFSIDLKTGWHLAMPIDQIRNLLTSLAQQYANEFLGARNVRAILDGGVMQLQAHLADGFAKAVTLSQMGLSLVDLRIADISPSKDLTRALQTPTFEKLQQLADEATFERRALAVEKERAIAENEMNTQIELAAKKSRLIEREDENARKQATAKAAAKKIESASDADHIRVVEQAKADMQRELVSVFKGTDPSVLIGLAAKDFVAKLNKIEHLSITPDMIAQFLSGAARPAAVASSAPAAEAAKR